MRGRVNVMPSEMKTEFIHHREHREIAEKTVFSACSVSSQETKFISTTEDTDDTEKRPKGKRLNFLCVLCVLCGSTKTANHNHRIERVSSRTPGPLAGLACSVVKASWLFRE